MLAWIDGPSGVGKTATAFELSRWLPGSNVCDPAHVGFGMRRMLGRGRAIRAAAAGGAG